MEKLRIGVVAPPWVPVPPPRYGGTEAVVDGLVRGLVEAGHEVVLFATGDSTCPVPLRFVYPEALGTGGSAEAEAFHVDQAYRELEGEVDLIHDHTLLGPLRWMMDSSRVPLVTTVHGPLTDEMVRHYEPIGRRASVVAISAAQAAAAPTVSVAAVIHHGLEAARFPMGSGDGGYVAFLGRMSPDKGPHRAIAAARAAGVPIRLAAKMWEPVERAFFAAEVAPLLGDDARYVGEVGGAEKGAFLGGAMALLNPIRWPEPFGLVMIEALACGTPVITFAEGSAPEIVRDGIDGFVCAGEEEMGAAIAGVGRLSRAACRAGVEQRFSVRRMVADHLALYRRLVPLRSAPAPAPAPV